MECWKISSFAKDVSDFIHLAQKYEVPIDLSQLYVLDSTFQYQKEHYVEIDDIAFTIDKKIAGTSPEHVYKFTVFFSHKCEIDSETNFGINDPIKKGCYSFQVKIIGYGNNDAEFINWWHLDQNEEKAGDNEPKYTHPYYHFQAGGNDLEYVDTGGLILLGSPRLPHPPMDLFLGIHFIINNFYSSKDYPFVKNILSDEVYQDIILRAQERMWKPYFSAFTEPNNHKDYTFNRVFPLYLQMGA